MERNYLQKCKQISGKIQSSTKMSASIDIDEKNYRRIKSLYLNRIQS